MPSTKLFIFLLCLHEQTLTFFQVELMTSSGRRVKKRNLDECHGTISGSNRMKKSRSSRKVSKRKSSKAKIMRPQRVAALNALNMFSQITGTSSDEEDENGSENDSSDSESVLQDSDIQSNESDANLQNMQQKCTKEEHSSLDELTDVAKLPASSESQSIVGNKRRLVLKFSLRDSKKHVSPEDTRLKCDNEAGLVNPFSRSQEATQEDRTDQSSIDPMSSSTDIIDVELSQTRNDCMDRVQHGKAEDHLEACTGDEENKKRWGDVMPRDASTELNANFDVPKENNTEVNGYVKPDSTSVKFSASNLIENHGIMFSCRDEKQFGTDGSQNLDTARNKDHAYPDGALISESLFESLLPGDQQPKADASAASFNGNFNTGYIDDSLEINKVVGTNHSNEPKEDAPLRSTKLIIKTKKRIVMDPKTPSKLKFVTAVEDQSSARGVLKPESQLYRDPNLVLKVPEQGEATGRLWHSYSDIRMSDAAYGDENTAVNDHHDLETDVIETSTDAIRRTRSMKMKATSRDPNAVNRNFKVRRGHTSEGTSRNAENLSLEFSGQLLQRSRSTRYQRGGYNDNEPSFSTRRKPNYSVRKLSWLMLSEHEEGYRYIPQLGDEVVYLRQVMPHYS